MKIFVSVLVFFLSVGLVAQEDTLKGKNYKELTTVLRANLQDSTLALAITKYYIDKAQKEKQLNREAEGLLSLALIYSQHLDLPNSITEIDKTLEFVKKHDLDSIRGRTYQAAGGLYLGSGYIQRSIEVTEEAIQFATTTGNDVLKKQAEGLLDFIGSIGGENEAAISKYKKELHHLIYNPDKSLSPEAIETKKMQLELFIGDAYVKMEKGDSAVKYIRKSLQKSLPNPKDTCFTKSLYMMLGTAEILIEDFSGAKKSFDYSLQYCRPITKFDSLLVGMGYGKVAYKQGKYQEAIVYMEKALETYEITETGESYMQDFYMVLADSYKEAGNLEKANTYFQKHVYTTTQFSKVQDSIQGTIRENEIERFEAELAVLNEEKNQKQNYLNYLLLGGSVVILVLLFLLLKFYKTKKENEQKFTVLLAKIEAANTSEEIIDTKDEVLEERSTNDLPEETKQQILEGLKKLEAKEYFLSKECNSYNVAKKIGTNTSYLSKVVNTHYGKNFNTYINDLRINYAVIRLKNDVFFRGYSIQAIAEELGYKSADSFTKYFKKDTGLNPSFYIKNIKNMA